MSTGASQRKGLGQKGEKIAASYLKRRGYEILQTNYRCPWGEIDIVARKGDCLVFVEVRTRTGEAYGTPAESITPVKRQRLATALLTYLQALDSMPKEWRVDLVSVAFDRPGGKARVERVENIVEAFQE